MSVWPAIARERGYVKSTSQKIKGTLRDSSEHELVQRMEET